MTLNRTKRLISSTVLLLVAWVVVGAHAVLDPRSRVNAQAPCSWSVEEVFVISGKLTDEQDKLIDKLLEALQNAVGGAIPEVAAVKTAIDEIGMGGDTVDVEVIYVCTDKAGKVSRRRARLDSVNEAVWWAAKFKFVSGRAKAERDDARQEAIKNHRPRASCCAPRKPTAEEPGGKKNPGPCKPPPPCKECMPIYDSIVSACDRIEKIGTEQSHLSTQFTPFEERREIAAEELKSLRAQGASAADIKAKRAELQKLVEQVDEFISKSADLRAEQGKLEADLKSLSAELKTCEKDQCGKTATGGGTIDACLVGEWISQDTTDIGGAVGRGNIKMTVGPDARVTIDYDRMNPKKLTNPVNGQIDMITEWKGAATGRIIGKNGVIVPQSIQSSNLVATITQYGKTVTRPGGGLGIVAPPPPNLVKYECVQKSLKISVNFFGEIVEGFVFVKK